MCLTQNLRGGYIGIVKTRVNVSSYEAEAHEKGLINLRHGNGFYDPQTADETPAINGTDLIQENGGFLSKAGFARTDEHLGRIERRIHARGDGCYDRDWTPAIRGIVLENKGGAGLPDLRADARIEINEVDLAATRISHVRRMRHNSSSRENHSAVSARSRSARRRAPALSCS